MTRLCATDPLENPCITAPKYQNMSLITSHFVQNWNDGDAVRLNAFVRYIENSNFRLSTRGNDQPIGIAIKETTQICDSSR